MNVPEAINPEFRAPQSDINVQFSPTADRDLNSIKSPAEAAEKFEKILIQQFVQVMTQKMFDSNLAGEDGPGWMKAYGNQQRDTLTNVLTDHLVEKGTFNISSDILAQWQSRGLYQEDPSTP